MKWVKLNNFLDPEKFNRLVFRIQRTAALATKRESPQRKKKKAEGNIRSSNATCASGRTGAVGGMQTQGS